MLIRGKQRRRFHHEENTQYASCRRYAGYGADRLRRLRFEQLRQRKQRLRQHRFRRAFKIGGTGPLTGAAAIYGNACKNGAQIAVDEINAEGGDIQFELNYQDDEHDAEKAVNAYNTLKDWGMQLSLGSVTSKPCEATAAENYSDRIFALTPSASTVAVTADKDNVFQMCFVDPNQGTASAQYIAEQKLGTKVAIIWKNDDVYSTGIHDKFVEEAKTKGLQVVSDNTFTDASANDFSVQLNDAKSKGADLVFLPMYYQPASLILTQANSMATSRSSSV